MTHGIRFTIQYPMNHGYDRRFLDPEVMASYARAAEQAGFDAIAFTEHPAPSHKWLSAGGHESLDPLTALSYLAGVTSRLRLLTYLLVLPYRNPLLLAKQVATADVVSGGRVTLAVGTGYLRSEFAALGVDFDERNALFDEALEVMRGIWTTEDYRFTGKHFTALGQTQRPQPVQQPHPPLWFGGNSMAARRRAARIGQGWTPLLIGEQMSRTTRTPAISTIAELGTAIDQLRQLTADAGRDPAAVDVQVDWRSAGDMDGETARLLDGLGELAAAGATWVVVEPTNDDVERALDQIAAFGQQVITAGAR